MHTIIAVPFDETLAEFIGKKGSENSITFFNRKLNDDVIVALQPSSIEDKFYALPQSMLLSDQIIVSTKNMDKLFGEVIVACSLLKKRVIFTKDNDIASILSNVKLENHIFNDREELLNSITSYKSNGKNEDKTRIDIDKAFNVKGVGVVALGFVTKGTVKVHDEMLHNSGKKVIIRSIQSQDEDVKTATKGTRVGLALKGIDESDMQKGDVLANTTIKPTKSITVQANQSKFVTEQIETGKVYFIAIGFSYVNATVESIDGNKIKFNFDKLVPVEINDEVIIIRTLVPRIFASGTIISV
ncbi:MAG: EF-Tu/IF-2/RF-3 family GTPase [Candidatus Micrarchaeaceae archaeon]